MKVEDYKCNFCGETLGNLEELIGINMNSDAILYSAPTKEAEYHLCQDCLVSIVEFSNRLEVD